MTDGNHLGYKKLAETPLAFLALSGMTIQSFDVHYEHIEAACQRGEMQRRSEGIVKGGHPFALSLRDRMLLGQIRLVHRPSYPNLARWFRISRVAVWRTLKNIDAILAGCGLDVGATQPADDERVEWIRLGATEFPELRIMALDFRWSRGFDLDRIEPWKTDPRRISLADIRRKHAEWLAQDAAARVVEKQERRARMAAEAQMSF
ncbi:MAG: hypothetical protein AB7I37_12255 [Pirellulales bacterium]